MMLRIKLCVRHEWRGSELRAALGKNLGAFAFRFEGIIVANQELPLRPEVGRSWHVVLRVCEGALARNGEVLRPGTTLLLPEESILPSAAVDLDLRTHGEAVTLVAMRLPSAAVTEPGVPRVLPDDLAWGRLDALGDALLAETASNEDVACSLTTIWDALTAGGFALPRPVEPTDDDFDRAAARVGHALSFALSQLEKNPQLIDLLDEAGVTERQLLRDLVDVQARFGIVVRGWRGTLNYWRIVSATMFLAARELSIAEVARVVGFASTSTMARAFRNAGLSRPMEIRERLLAADG